MTHLLEKNTPFIFSEECIQAFQTLKKKLTKAPILIAPDWDQPFELMCDASDYVIGAALGQQIKKHFRPIHYASKTMTEAESNYTIMEKEMLAMVSFTTSYISLIIIFSFSYVFTFNFEDEEARDNFLKDVCTFLRKFSRIPFGVTPKVILIAWERFGEIKDALMDKQYQQEDIQELMSKLLEDVRNIREELSEYNNCPSWNRPTFYDNDDDEYTIIYRKPTTITPDLPIEELDNSLSMGDEHLDTIPSIENLVPILSEFKGISDDTCDVPVCEDSSTFDALSDHSEILSDSNNDGTSSDDDSYKNIEYVEASLLNLEYVSLEEVNEDQEEKEFDLKDIFQIQDVILREKLLNISHLITNIESLKDNPIPNRVLKSPSSVHISVTDSGSFFEESETFLSHLDNSLPEFDTFSDHTEETRSGSTTTHANNSLPEYDSFFLRLSPIREGGDEIDVEDDNSFTFVIRTFLPFLTYLEVSPLLLSTRSEDTIFNPGISI
ncbi:reverse transcriptase domain-containing protein [Tanacetum coccineum]